MLLDTITYRLSGHSTSDQNAYRTKEEIEAWRAIDPIVTYRQSLVEGGDRLRLAGGIKGGDILVGEHEPLHVGGIVVESALNGTDPVVFFESQRIYDVGEQFHEGGVPAGRYEIPIGDTNLIRQGKDLTIITIGAALYRAVDAAKELSEKYGLEEYRFYTPSRALRSCSASVQL